MKYGLTKNGFFIKELSDTYDDIVTRIRTKYPDAVLSDATIEGNFILISAELQADLWQELAALDALLSMDAEGKALDNILTFNNILRRPAKKALLLIKVISTANDTIPTGSMFGFTDLPTVNFVTVEDTPVVIGENLVVIRSKDVNEVSLGDNVIDTLKTSLSFVTSVEQIPNSFIQGANLETDDDMQLRRALGYSMVLSGSNQGIKASLEFLNSDETSVPIDYINVVSNRTHYVDASGRPPHSIEPVLSDPSVYATLALGDIVTDTSMLYITGDFTSELLGHKLIVITEPTSSPTETAEFSKYSILSVAYDSGTNKTSVTLCDKYTGVTGEKDIKTVLFSRDFEIAEVIGKSAGGGIGLVGNSHILTSINNVDYVMRYSSVINVDVRLTCRVIVNAHITNEEIEAIKADIVNWGNKLGIGTDVVTRGYNCLLSNFNNSKIFDVDQIDINGSSNVLFIGDGKNGTAVEKSVWRIEDIHIVEGNI